MPKWCKRDFFISLKMFIFWTYAYKNIPFSTNFPKDMSISQKLFHLSKIGSDIILVEVLGFYWDKQNVNIFDGVFWEFFLNFIQFRQKNVDLSQNSTFFSETKVFFAFLDGFTSEYMIKTIVNIQTQKFGLSCLPLP